MDASQYPLNAPLLSYRAEYQIQPTYLDAPRMDRDYGSRSSMSSSTSRYSTGSNPYNGSSPGSSYCPSYGSPSEDYMTPRGSSPRPSQDQSYSLSPKTEELIQAPFQVDQDLPPFDPEKEGDPRIGWEMYYDFMVTKTEAFWKLRQGYVPSQTYPTRIKSEVVMGKSSDQKNKAEKRHTCRILDCKAKPFTRHYDLERHFRTVHGGTAPSSGSSSGLNSGKEGVHHCDYLKCKHEEALRKDHCREHYREFHMEDLVKRGPRPEDPDLKQWWSRRNISKTWWRCCKCLKKTKCNEGWKCKSCNQMCEPERIEMRKKFVEKSMKEEPTSRFSNTFSDPSESFPSPDCLACGENQGWVFSESTGRWIRCQLCQPEFNSTTYLV